ncbi:MAG: hypothetical protein ABIQ86_04420 [Steroidobacteraceae bacterium]
MTDVDLLTGRIEVIERCYEYLLAYAAQGRQDETGTELRDTLMRMHEALTDMQGSIRGRFSGLPALSGVADFTDVVERDVKAARGAIGLVLSRDRIASLLVDNLNASVHLRALLTDLFLIEQAGKAAPLRGA